MSLEHQDILMSSHTFLYPWESVVKGFWTKYPNKKLSSVIFNKVIDMEIIDDTKLLIKRMMFSKFFFFWGHSIENIVIDLQNKNLTMVSTVTKRSKFAPHGTEICIYKAIEEEEGEAKDNSEQNKKWEGGWKREEEDLNKVRKEGGGKTLYTKELFSFVRIMKLLENLNHSFKTGCSVVEELSRSFENNKEL